MYSPLPSSLFQSLIQESLDAVVIIDNKGIIRYANPAFEQLTGYFTNELLDAAFNAMLPDFVAAQHDTYLNSYASRPGYSNVLGQVREMQLRHCTGELIPVEMKAVDIGKVDDCYYFAAFMTDLRPRKHLETQNDSLLAEFEKLALTDMLTELPNRRAFDTEALRMLAVAKREQHSLCIGVGDLDHFKRINDDHGHHVGDIVLKEVAHTLKETLRAGDYIGRTGGEEFGIIFAVSSLETASAVANRIRQAVEEREIMVDGARLKVTISIGIACVAPSIGLDEAKDRADKALYKAKNNGRNRVECDDRS